MADVIESVKTVLEPKLEAQGFYLWDVEYEKLGSDMILRTLVDRKDGQINMDDLVNLTETIGDLVDGITPDPFPEAYLLDVSSPGAERSLKRTSDYTWALHKTIHVDLKNAIDGQTELDGEVVAVTDLGVTLEVTVKAKRVSTEIEWDQIKQAHVSLSQDRILTTEEDFAWALNKLVLVTTYQKIDGKKEFSGELVGVTDENLIVEEDEQQFEIPRQSIAQARHINTY
ncbi:MAG: ribosome maturation factor RimP [Lactobacillaceae bacterium]|nr:ribosome maturation factor RimP [Lactobacillaceae bacterium]